MGAFTDDMSRLSEEIAAGRVSRKEMLHNLKGGIAMLKTDVDKMLMEFGTKRAETKQQIQSRLQRFTEELGEQVIDMRKGFHNERADMLEKMNDGLKHFMDALKDEVAQMQMRFGRERSHMKQHMDEELKDFISRLNDDVGQTRKGFHQAHSEMATRLQTELTGFTNELKTNVGSMLDAFRSDRQGAREAWMGKGRDAKQPEAFEPEKAVKPGEDDSTPVLAVEEKKDEPQEAVTQGDDDPAPMSEILEETPQLKETVTQSDDDLTCIQGIGDQRQKLLNRSGIHTFAELASATPKEIRQMIGKHGKLANVEEWITNAASMIR